MRTQNVLNGIDGLLTQKMSLLRNDRVGLIAHPASTGAQGCSSAVLLQRAIGDQLVALFSPEHGFFGIAAAGEKVASVKHPTWEIPVYSLYGKTRRPSSAMLRNIDTIIYDLQDLSIRCYTYVSTLRYVLEAAEQNGKRVIVTDRPNPLAHMIDGPMLDSRVESFVGNFPGPLVYGLTAGEAALWLKKKLKLNVQLEVVPVQKYRRGIDVSSEQWVSPSPAIRNQHTALCYPITVCYEALPAIDYGRTSLMPFELVGSPGLNEDELAEKLTKEKLRGIEFHPVVYEQNGNVMHGVRMTVLDRSSYRPVATSVAVLTVLQKLMGHRTLWKTKGSRTAFLDKLYGTDSVRRGIQSGATWRKIVSSWPLESWNKKTAAIRMYS